MQDAPKLTLTFTCHFDQHLFATIGYIVIPCECASGNPLHIIVDTGSPKTILFHQVIGAHSFDSAKIPLWLTNQDTSYLKFPITGTLIQIAYQIAEIPENFYPATKLPRTIAGLIGNNFLKQTKAIIDYPSKTITLSF